jgi:O-acetyl-ADP-ribose deacetylase (regulator of RNase III)
VAIEVREGDLLDSGCEAIVNPANGGLAHGAGAAAAIRKAAGEDEFDQLCSSALDALVRARSPKVGGDGKLLVGGALTTGPCQLRSKGVKVVVHAVGPYHRTGDQAEENSFLSAIRAAFEEAVKAGCKSVSLPLMGAGVYSWSPKDSANIMLLALSQAVAQYGNSSPITHIVLVDFLPAHATAFKEALTSYVAGSSGSGTGDVPRPQVVVPRAPEFKWYWEKFGDWVGYDYDQAMQIERAIRDGSLPVTITGDVAGQFSDSKHKPAGALAPVYAVSKEPTKAPDGKTYEFRQVNVASNFFRAVKCEPFKAGDVMHGYTPQTSAGNLCTCTSSLISRDSDVFLPGCASTIFYVLVKTVTMPKLSHFL